MTVIAAVNLFLVFLTWLHYQVQEEPVSPAGRDLMVWQLWSLGFLSLSWIPYGALLVVIAAVATVLSAVSCLYTIWEEEQ
jgi:hypothetical protein